VATSMSWQSAWPLANLCSSSVVGLFLTRQSHFSSRSSDPRIVVLQWNPILRRASEQQVFGCSYLSVANSILPNAVFEAKVSELQRHDSLHCMTNQKSTVTQLSVASEPSMPRSLNPARGQFVVVRSSKVHISAPCGS
jgi:hypothetical protein